jgi:hypothetical protein
MKTLAQTIISFLLVILTIDTSAQHLGDSNFSDTNRHALDKKVIAEYSGGRFGFSSISLTLYSDSTYLYTSWLHTGDSYEDQGIFSRSKSKIRLRSDTLITVKSFLGQRSFNAFDNKTYRLRGDKILLYTMRQEIFDRADYYAAYFTLYLIDRKKTE